MEKRRRKKRSRTAKTKKVVVKSNVRLFSASDVIWMMQCDEDRERKIVEAKVGPSGIHIRMEHGVDRDGDKTYAVHEYDWESVAINLGFDAAELVIDQFRNWYVLLYDKEKVDA